MHPELRIRYSPEEFLRLKKAFARTGYNQIGTYARVMTLGEPVEIVYRNGSFDSFVEEIGQLRRELVAIRNESSPADQPQLLRVQEKIQTSINKIVELCMQSLVPTPVQ